MNYNESIDSDDQITAEEHIAAHIFDAVDAVDEETAAQLGRDILLLVLQRFRPDLIDT